MKKIYCYFILLCLGLNLMAQDNAHVLVPFTAQTPNIDGIEDLAWNKVPGDTIKNFFQEEVPTVEGSYWKALWDQTYLYVLVVVKDDDHWPAYLAGGSWFEYDQPEVYLDINEDLNDGFGPGANQGTGHYQVQPGFVKDGSGVLGDLAASNYRPGGKYAYMVEGEDYVFEYAIDISTLKNKAGETMTAAALEALDSIGFDVTIIDQDEGVTTARQRAVWQNVGEKDENYANMDDAGTIALVQELPPESIIPQKITSLSVYPNPVSDYLVVNAEFNKIIITNILGIEVSTIETSEKNITMEFLPSGIYILQVYNNENLVGMSKIYKN